MYSRMLVPLDGSRLAEAVLPTVEALATSWGATVLLLHVIERDAPVAVHGDRHLTTVGQAAPYLAEIAARLRRMGIPSETHAHPAPEGDVARSIAEHSTEQHAALVVLCTHGRGTVRDLLFGRIAQQVLRRGVAPVLLIRPTADGSAPSFHPREVLVPLDGTPSAEAALAPALEIARALGASARVVVVVPTQETLRGDRQAIGTLLPAATRAALDLEQNNAHSYLASLAEGLRRQAPDVQLRAEVCRGDIADALVERANAPEVGLVAIATHGRAGLQAFWTGSVTSQILARTHAPVLLVHAAEG